MVVCSWLMDVMRMKDGLKSAAMECGVPFMLEAGTLTMPQLSVDSLDISNTQVTFRIIVHNNIPRSYLFMPLYYCTAYP